MNRWPMGVAVDQMLDTLGAHDALDFGWIDVGDVRRFLLSSLPAGFP
jgi:hypothetical protein